MTSQDLFLVLGVAGETRDLDPVEHAALSAVYRYAVKLEKTEADYMGVS